MVKMPRTGLLVLVVLSATAVGATEPTGARAVVERLHATLLEAMTTADALGYQGRYDLLAPVVAESFDFSTIARIVTGRHWKELGSAQRQTFTEVFARLSTGTYASNFSSFSGEHFETGVEESQRGHVMVKTKLVKSDGKQVELDYLLREQDKEWRIINVIAQGVSDLSLKRADYTAIIKSEGFDALVDKLNGKIAALESKTK